MVYTKEEKRLYDKQYREKNKEKRKLQSKEWYENNKEKAKETKKEWCQTNKEKRKLQLKKYNENKKTENPLYYKLKQMVHTTKKSDIQYNRYNNEDHITYEFLQEQYTKQDNKCGYCQVIMEHTFEKTSNPNQISIERIDNTIGHTIENCIFACCKCNRFTEHKKLECSI